MRNTVGNFGVRQSSTSFEGNHSQNMAADGIMLQILSVFQKIGLEDHMIGING